MAVKQISGLYDLDFMKNEINSYPIPTKSNIQDAITTLQSILDKTYVSCEIKQLAKRLLSEFNNDEMFVTTSSDSTIEPSAQLVPTEQSSYEWEVEFNAAFAVETFYGKKALEPNNFSITNEDKLKYWYQCYQGFIRWRKYENDNKFFSQ